MADVSEQIQALGLELAAYAKTGPASPSQATEIKQRVAEFIEANAVTLESAVQTYRRACDGFLARVIEARGLPVASVVSGEAPNAQPGPRPLDKKLSERFDEYLPSLRRLLDECVAVHADQAEGFFAQQKSAVEKLLADFLDSIPGGGTKAAVVRSHVNPIKNALRDLLQWGEELNRLQATSFMSEVRDFLAQAANHPIAMTWHFAPWSCLVPGHRELDGQVFVIRENWALQKGLMVAPPAHGFADDAKRRRRELGCMCTTGFIFNLASLPRDMLTPSGVATLANAATAREDFSRRLAAAPQPDQAPSPEPAKVSSAGFFARLFGRKADT